MFAFQVWCVVDDVEDVGCVVDEVGSVVGRSASLMGFTGGVSVLTVICEQQRHAYEDKAFANQPWIN